ncbi:hypothetical protein WMY93_029832 [Mugilogobius chulae]|uniref:C2H2-type domain-containing protein n=1 Tax=Mugilogobius chulae TaxID=88201 RepID=A0AAW0MSW0_9GOBI
MCPVRGCFSQVQHMRHHLRGHKDLTAAQQEKQLRAARHKSGLKKLAQLRARNPDPPMVTNLDIEQGPKCTNPRCRDKISALEAENASLKERLHRYKASAEGASSSTGPVVVHIPYLPFPTTCNLSYQALMRTGREKERGECPRGKQRTKSNTRGLHHLHEGVGAFALGSSTNQIAGLARGHVPYTGGTYFYSKSHRPIKSQASLGGHSWLRPLHLGPLIFTQRVIDQSNRWGVTRGHASYTGGPYFYSKGHRPIKSQASLGGHSWPRPLFIYNFF